MDFKTFWPTKKIINIAKSKNFIKYYELGKSKILSKAFLKQKTFKFLFLTNLKKKCNATSMSRGPIAKKKKSLVHVSLCYNYKKIYIRNWTFKKTHIATMWDRSTFYKTKSTFDKLYFIIF